MHVLQLIPSLDVGGVERGVLDLAAGLIRRGHQVSVVSAGGALVEPLRQLGAKHHTLPIDRKAPWAIWQHVPALAHLIRATGVDIVHARSRVPAWAGYLAARQAGVPFVTTCHGFYAPHPASRAMTWGRLVIVPSQALGRYLIDRFGFPPQRLRVVPRGVDLAAFRLRASGPRAPGPWRIGIIGRLSALKGHAVAIRALHQLVQQRLPTEAGTPPLDGVAEGRVPPHSAFRSLSDSGRSRSAETRSVRPVVLRVIGDAPAHKPLVRQRLGQLAESLGVAQAIEWMGTQQDVAACLQSLDVLLMPSIYPESFGRSVIEAQAVGVPVIASRIGALAEIVEDGRTGLLVAPRDPGALAQAIARLIHDESLRARLARQARGRVEETFSADRMVEGTLAVYEECVQRPRIVVWKLSALGDLILATPSLRAIRRHYPNATITLVVDRAYYEAIARCPYVNEVLVYDPRRRERTLLGKWAFARRLAREGADGSIDLQNSRATHLLAWLAGIPLRIGYRRRFGRLLNRPVTLPRTPMHPVAHQQHLLKRAGIEPDGDRLELWPSPLDEQRLERWLRDAGVDGSKPLVGLHLGASKRWNTKRWDVERWAALCDHLAQRGSQPVLTGTAEDRELGAQVRSLSRARPIEALGVLRLMELACLIRRCRVYVTTDSAPLHLAAAMGTPTVALFGPTDPARHAPQAPSVRVLKKDLACSPCYSTWCRTVTHACMKQITVDEVLQAIADCGLRNADLKTINPKSEIRNPKSS